MRALTLMAAIWVAPSFALAQSSAVTSTTAASYYGGTLAAFRSATSAVESTLTISDSPLLVLAPTERKWVSAVVRIPFDGIQTINYERRDTRRMGKRSIGGALVGGLAGAALASDLVAQHLITIRYTDPASAKSELIIIDLDPATADSVMSEIERRSGKERIERPKILGAPPTYIPPQTPATSAPASQAVVPAQPVQNSRPRTPMTNGDIVKMVQAGMGEDLVVARIKSAAPHFDTSADALVALKIAGVSERIIAVVLDVNP